MIFHNRFTFARITALSISGLFVAGTSPLSSAEEKGKIEEIVVTAQKREESLQRVPISITAMTSQDLEVRGITSLDTALAATPSITTEPAYERTASLIIYIRGMGNVAP